MRKPTLTLGSSPRSAEGERAGGAFGRRSDQWGRVVRALVPLGALWIEGIPALVGAALITEGGIYLARRVGGPRHGVWLFAAAYGLRLALTFPSHVVAKLGNGNGALFQDDYTYDLVG